MKASQVKANPMDTRLVKRGNEEVGACHHCKKELRPTHGVMVAQKRYCHYGCYSEDAIGRKR